jgi:hypothetical protein
MLLGLWHFLKLLQLPRAREGITMSDANEIELVYPKATRKRRSHGQRKGTTHLLKLNLAQDDLESEQSSQVNPKWKVFKQQMDLNLSQKSKWMKCYWLGHRKQVVTIQEASSRISTKWNTL